MEHAQLVTIDFIYLKHLTLNIYPDVDLKALYSHTRGVLNEHVDTCVDMPPIQGDRYHGLYDILAGKRACSILQFDPLIESNAPFRLAIKPSVGGADSHRLIRCLLTEIFGLDYERHMNTAKISGYELAIEVAGAALEDLLIFDSTKRVSSRHYDEHGRLSSVQLGAETSDQRITLENKMATRIGSGSTKELSTALVEMVVKVRAGETSIHDAASIPNPLASLSFMRLPRTFHGSGSAAWRGFLDSCQLRGMQAALPRLPKPELRTKFRERVAERLAVNWWHPSAYWAAFPAMVSEIGLISCLPKPMNANPTARIQGGQQK